VPEDDASQESRTVKNSQTALQNESRSSRTLSPVQSLVLTLVIPSLYLVGLLVAWFGPMHFGFGTRWLVYVGLTLGLSGLLLWIVAMVQLGRSLAVLPGGDQLVTHGVYRYIRHPVYWAIVLTFAGLFLAVGSTYGMIYLAVVVVPLNLVRARFEDRGLLKQFGEQYQAYRERTWF
jgi:protein-S-isoprenylcysteine O-methyltransferase Ste14